MSVHAQRELARQQRLLRSLWRCDADASLLASVHETGARAQQGLDAYRGNAQAIAERTLAAAFPTLQQLVGGESFAQLARAFWHRHPPRRGDLTHYGDALPDWIADDPQLAPEPYLADVARVDWAVHAIEHAADVAPEPDGLQLLGEREPAQLTLRLRPGLRCIVSRWPVVAIWQAHRSNAADRFAAVRQAFDDRVAENALVSRPHWRASVSMIDAAGARFVAALHDAMPLSRALDAAGASFDFEAWLRDALRQQWLLAVQPVADAPAGVR